MSKKSFTQTPAASYDYEDAAIPYLPGVAAVCGVQTQIEAAKQRNERFLMAIDGVEGISLGQNAIGDDTIVLYLRDASVKRLVPAQIEGYPVETSITGHIDAYARR